MFVQQVSVQVYMSPNCEILYLINYIACGLHVWYNIEKLKGNVPKPLKSRFTNKYPVDCIEVRDAMEISGSRTLACAPIGDI